MCITEKWEMACIETLMKTNHFTMDFRNNVSMARTLVSVLLLRL